MHGSLWALLFLVFISPSGAEVKTIMTERQRQDSIIYYRINTINNWKLIERHIKK